jgi:eukaryotic-like serine/threonine-protein kinase
MALTKGAYLGVYEIVAPLGQGGMGEVYRARDARLGRDVAVKILPAGATADADRLRRFEQEARAAGSLNHPNILAIHDIGTQDGTPYVVSELLEGETLRDHLAGGALSSRKVIDYAIQLARGLAAAHDKGIVHRDLKPENIFLTSDGRVKILDFGLAKLTESMSDGGAPTALAPPRVNTDPGTVLGTVGYMSPEQVRGQPSDHRSDIFSMGAVLYEMLSGKRVFTGDSAVETMHAILKRDVPPLVEGGHAVAPALQRVVDHCLEKVPAQRFQSARDLAFALETLSGSTVSGGVPAMSGGAPSSQAKNRRHLAWLIAGASTLGLVVALLAIALLPRPTASSSAIRFPIPLPEKVSSYFFSVLSTNLSVSPDGRQLVFVGMSEGQRLLWLRRLDTLVAHAVPGTEGAYSPFWSPDSRYVAFFAGGKLKRIDPSGSSAQIICDLPGEIEAVGTWGRDGAILYGHRQGDAPVLFQVAATGGPPTVVARDPPPQWPHFLPDGRHYLFYAWNEQDAAKRGIFVASIGANEARLLVPTGLTRAEYSAGYLVYTRDGSLVARHFDEKTLQLSGEAITVVEHIPYFDKTGWGGFSLSTSGVLAYQTRLLPERLLWVDRSGRETGQIDVADAWNMRISPDGRRVALVKADRARLSSEIWIHELGRGTSTRFALGPSDNGDPVWSPDGKRLAFFSCCQQPPNVQSTFRIKDVVDTGNGVSSGPPGFDSPSDWSPDGRFVLFVRSWSPSRDPTGASNNQDIWVLSVDTDRKTVPFLETPFNETDARFSPDGRWVAYSSNETTRDEIYVTRFERPGERWRVSIDGGRSPRWRRDGKELFFLSADNRVMAASSTPGDRFETGLPVPLFRTDSPVNTGWDAAADGQHFIVASPPATYEMPFTVVVNWTADLKP